MTVPLPPPDFPQAGYRHMNWPMEDCTGRTSEECRADRALNAEMKRLWNTQTPNAEVTGRL